MSEDFHYVLTTEMLKLKPLLSDMSPESCLPQMSLSIQQGLHQGLHQLQCLQSLQLILLC